MKQTKLNVIEKAIEEKKGEDIVTINIEEKSPFWSYSFPIFHPRSFVKVLFMIASEVSRTL